MADSDSDYNVDDFVKPDVIRKPINDDSADLLGNFDDVKRKEILDGTYEDKMASDDDRLSGEEGETTDDEETNTEDSDDEMEGVDDNKPNTEDDNAAATPTAGYVNPFGKKSLTKDQLAQLMKGAAKTNRYVLYVTNLNFETTKSDLEEHFSEAGSVRSIRIPKKRNGGFAFVEMNDLESFHKGFELHNTELKGRWIKVQFSEAGKKKSANKKNIMKQKNRKLAEMRNENKTFTKSGKFYDKTLKKEKASKLMASKKWRKKPAGGGPPRPK
uniref:RRM domain-containing protein n=1 Tax=Stomoxys calcitrans TaxID=35570 RepID=A0A1I8NL99_STOCA